MKLQHTELACHQQSLVQQLRDFWKDGHLCDVVLKSVDGTLHPAHRNVLSAASDALKTWLCAPFREAEEIRQGNPVQMTASSRVVDAFLDYLYGGDPEVASTDAMELLRLACRYELPRLSASLASDLRASLDSKLALQLLPEAQVFGLDELRQACEEHIAHDFQQCALQQDFLELSAPQLQRILQRRDLKVSREETIVEGLLKWSNFRSERNREMVLLLADIDFPSLSAGNLEILRRAAQSFGPAGGYLECHVREAMAVHRKRPVGDISNSHPPKRRCLARWSAGLGASHPPHHEENRVTPHISSCGPTLQWHQGAFLLRDNGNDRVVSCKPCDTSFRIYAGQGAPVNGFNDLSRSTEHAVSPAGELFVVLFQDTGQHLLRIHDGVGQVLLELTDCVGLCCSPNGVLYVLENRGQRVQKLEGLALTTIFHTGQLPAGQQGSFKDMFVTGEEVLYITQHSRVLRLRAGDSVPSVVAEFVEREITQLTKLFVTEEEQIFLVDPEKKRVWMTQPELSQAGVAALDTSSIGIPRDVLIQDRLMYVLVRGPPGSEGSAVYQYPLPPRLELEAS